MSIPQSYQGLFLAFTLFMAFVLSRGLDPVSRMVGIASLGLAIIIGAFVVHDLIEENRA